MADQWRVHCEFESSLDRSLCHVIGGRKRVCYKTTAMPVDASQLSEDVVDSSQALLRNKRYEEAVVRNNYLAAEQAKSYINYASQREMMTVKKEYAALLQLCTNLVKRDCGDVDDEVEKKCLFLRFGVKKWKVMCATFEELVAEAKEIVAGCEVDKYRERTRDYC